LAVGGFVLVLALILFLPRLPNIVAQIAGLQSQGETAQVFANVTPVATVILNNIVTPDAVMVQVGTYGQSTLNNTRPQLYEFTLGQNANGASVLRAEVSEQGVQDLCRQRSPVCAGTSPDLRVRNVQIDLRPGGAIVNADVTLPELGGFSQRVGVVLQWNSGTRRVEVAGIDLNGILYNQVPANLPIRFDEIEQIANDALTQTIAQINGQQYRLTDLTITENGLSVTLQ